MNGRKNRVPDSDLHPMVRRTQMSIASQTARWLPIVAYSAFIFYLSSGAVPGIFQLRFRSMDKLLHAGEFLVWGLLCGWAVATSFPGLSGRRLLFTVAIIGTLYGLSDELHQSLVPGRNADPWDVAADFTGSLVAGCIVCALSRRRQRANAGS